MLHTDAYHLLCELNENNIGGTIFRDIAYPFTAYINPLSGLREHWPNFIILTIDMIELPTVEIGLQYIETKKAKTHRSGPYSTSNLSHLSPTNGI